MINGSEGFQYAPFLTHNARPSVFTQTLKRHVHGWYDCSCVVNVVTRSAEVQFNNSVELLGIDLLRFGVAKGHHGDCGLFQSSSRSTEAFMNVSLNPNNCAYSAFGPSGVINMTAMIGGA
jgi:hypothetical protein